MKKENNYLQYVIIVLVFLLYQLPFLDSVKKIIVDESWYSNVAYNFSIGNGFINTNVGAFGGDVCFFYPLVEGTFFYIFGTSLYVARLVSILAGIISLFGILSVLNYLKIRNYVKYITVFLFIFSYNYFLIFRFARPEAWVLVSFIWIIYYQIRYWYEGKNIFLFLIGIFTGTSFLFHPWGLSFALLFGMYFVIISFNRKSVMPLLIYSAGVIPFVFLLFFNAVVLNNISLSVLLERFLDRSTVADSAFNSFQKVKSGFSNLFYKYNLKNGRLFIVLFHAFITCFGLTFYKKNKVIFRISVLQLVLFLITILSYSGRSMEFMLHYLFIFTFFNIALLMNENDLKYHLNKIIPILCFLFFLNNIIGIIAIEKKDYGSPYSEITNNIQPYIPKSSIVLAPIEMWFPCKESEFYNSNASWDFTKYKDVKELLDSKTIDYIISTEGVENPYSEENINTVEKFKYENGSVIYSFSTKNYGTISIWKVKK